MNTTPQANFLLIDGVLRPDAIARLYLQDEPLDIAPLYLGTRWSDLHDLGPILVGVQAGSRLLGKILKQTIAPPDTCLLYSRAPLNAVANHLRRFLAPPDALGSSGLLRFADPLVARHWLGSYQGAHLDGVLGPIETWHVPDLRHRWEPVAPGAWQRFVRAALPLEGGETPVHLGDRQLAALEHAARWRFTERLYDSFVQSHAEHLGRIDHRQLARWFDACLDEAHAWGLVSERSLAVWVEHSLRWGAGFIGRADGPYQQWLARTPDALKLPPERRLQQMDNACLVVEMNKEVR